jgi:hypothetical protein
VCVICHGLGPAQTTEGIGRYIALHGWAFQSVLAPDGIPMAYTVGLTDVGEPELVVRGLPQADAHDILDELAHRPLRGGTGLRAGWTTDGSGQRLLLSPYPHPQDLMRAVFYYAGDFAALQIIAQPSDLPLAAREPSPPRSGSSYRAVRAWNSCDGAQGRSPLHPALLPDCTPSRAA